ncbi:uncharacterized protein LOC127264026 [Andrographis paniculata]|uniref:uncharacterized protein LOC127264026 n=1 Tax=Andrographis paniculata TaxID=175694 RepID=UPI0021E7EB47|nr:uncharacterized protein LOC127264026 [Andrographis paniculata]
MMNKRRTLTMDWDGLGDDDDDDDRFFESCPRVSSADLCSSDSDDGEDFEDSRMSFASAVSTVSKKSLHPVGSFAKPQQSMLAGYDMWMSEPGDIRERRRRLLQGMGLASTKQMMRIASRNEGAEAAPAASPLVDSRPTVKGTRRDDEPVSISSSAAASPPVVDSRPTVKGTRRDDEPISISSSASASPSPSPSSPPHSCPRPTPAATLVRSRSDGDIVAFSAKSKLNKIDERGGGGGGGGGAGPVTSKHRLLTRTTSEIVVPVGRRVCGYSSNSDRMMSAGAGRSSNPTSNSLEEESDGAFCASFLIKNLDTGKEFVVKEQGSCNKVSDIQTGKQLTMEEFEKSVGFSQVVKELMSRQNVARGNPDDRKINHSYLSKSFRNSKKKGAAILKNIKGVATAIRHDHKEHDYDSTEDHKPPKATSKWVKTRQHGKTCKEFTALHMTQDIQAHDGPIWTIRFSSDGQLLATAGEDKVIHVWEVQECEVMSASGTPLHSTAAVASSDRAPLAEITPLPSDKWKKIRSYRRKGNSIPDHINVPETVFALSEKPICSLEGHQEDVLDLSWSKSKLLLSSSMDKTVRLWDLESRTCLKVFAHNDYVTCIQFNPVDDNHFMSGSLDAKVRIWNIPDHQVVDWIDLHEMVTAASYTPDGQGAVIGTHQGYCRFYTIDDHCKLECSSSVRMRTKAQTKKLPGFHHSQPQTNKITGFQFNPCNPSEVLITSTDSRIRLHNGSELVQKYRGFRNTSSQIAAFFSPDGRHVVSASEDSQVYIWKVEESKPQGQGADKKNRVTVQAHEHFHCKDVALAVPWPGAAIRNEPPLMVDLSSKRHSRRIATPPSPTHDPDRKQNSLLPPLPLPLPLPLPGRKASSVTADQDDLGQSGRMDPAGIGVASSSSSSFDGSSMPMSLGESPSFISGGSSRFENGNGNGNGNWGMVQATAWGMAMVTASVEGEMRVYQNFGLPLKVGRQPTNLFQH